MRYRVVNCIYVNNTNTERMKLYEALVSSRKITDKLMIRSIMIYNTIQMLREQLEYK